MAITAKLSGEIIVFLFQMDYEKLRNCLSSYLVR